MKMYAVKEQHIMNETARKRVFDITNIEQFIAI